MLDPFLMITKKSGSLEGKAALGCTVFTESSLVSRPVKPLRPLNRRGKHLGSVCAGRGYCRGWIPGWRKPVLRKSPVKEDVARRCISALGLIRDAATHQYQCIDVIADVDPTPAAAL